MTSEWTIFCQCKDQRKARKLLSRVLHGLQRTCEGDPFFESDAAVPGYRVCFCIELESDRWNDAVVELVSLGQKVGYDLRISLTPQLSSIHENACVSSGETTVSGVVGIEGEIFRDSRRQRSSQR